MSINSPKEPMSRDEIKFSPLSLVDDFGRVFFYKEKVYRQINKQHKEFCMQFLQSELFRELATRNLIPETKISCLEIEEGDLILEHEKLLVSYPHEWTFDMLRDAALTIIKVNFICNQHGYELKDGHFYNILFRGVQPVWIDLGSIRKVKSGAWSAYKEFLNLVVVPLTFWSKNNLFIASRLLENSSDSMRTIPRQGLEDSGLLEIIRGKKDSPYFFKFRNFKIFQTKKKNLLLIIVEKAGCFFTRTLNRRTVTFTYQKEVTSNSSIECFPPYESIAEYLQNLSEPSLGSQWQNYHQEYLKEEKITPTCRFNRILEVINELPGISTVIDLAANEGYFSQLLIKKFPWKRLIAVDYDANAINSCYKGFKKEKFENATSLLCNFMDSPDYDGTPARMKSDLVVALAVTHHLILTSNYPIDTILEKINSFSNKYVIVEFMPMGLWSSDFENVSSVPTWYSLEWFRDKFSEYFNLLLEEQTERNRIFFVGVKKEPKLQFS